MKKVVLYTARFSSPGRFRTHTSSLPAEDRIYYTDIDVEEGCHQMIPVGKDRTVKNDFYYIKKMNLNYISIPIKRQRFVKICIPDELFDNYEYSIYADIKRPITSNFDSMISFLQDGSDFLIRTHPERDCAYKEAEFLLRKNRYDNSDILKQVEFYKKEGFPTHSGLYWSAQLFRRHTKELKEFSKLWWEQVERFSYRDQISLPYVVWKTGIKISGKPRREWRKI